VLRRGALSHWLRGIGGARDRAGPLLCARDQARETGLPQMPGGPELSRLRPGAPRSWKRASSPTLWIVDVLIKKYHTLRTGIEMPIYFEPHTFRRLDMSSFRTIKGLAY